MSQTQPLRIRLHEFQQSNEEHSKWAKQYLAKKGVTDYRFGDPEDKDSAECVILPHQSTYENIDYNGIYKNMPLAWSQRKRRQKSDLKPYSFFMDKKVGAALNRLASRRESPISLALETLILEEKDLATEYEKKLKNSQKEYREWYSSKGGRHHKLLEDRNRKQIKRLWGALEELAHKVATYETSDQLDHTVVPDPDKASGASIKKKEEILKHYRDSIEPGSSEGASEAPSPPKTETTKQDDYAGIDQELIEELKKPDVEDSSNNNQGKVESGKKADESNSRLVESIMTNYKSDKHD
mgnify:CR=1 FL=1